jgi:hypothetical protein
MAVKFLENVQVRLFKPPSRDASALRELRQALLPLAPVLTAIARMGHQDALLRDKNILLPKLGEFSVQSVMDLCELLEKLDRDEYLAGRIQ